MATALANAWTPDVVRENIIRTLFMLEVIEAPPWIRFDDVINDGTEDRVLRFVHRRLKSLQRAAGHPLDSENARKLKALLKRRRLVWAM